MRKAFFNSLVKSAESDKDIILLSADLGFGFIEPYISKFPNQFINVGVSEQAMLGIANGLAIARKKVICYSIASFSLIRPFEFFRNGAIAQHSGVMVVGVGPGFDYSQDGLTHYCLEDLALVQSQPGLLIKTPATPTDVSASLLNFVSNPVPTYLRLPRSYSKIDYSDVATTEIIETDVLIISTSLMFERTEQIVTSLSNSGIKIIVRKITELSTQVDLLLIKQLSLSKVCLVVEDHYEFGGVGSRISDLILKHYLNTKLIKDAVVLFPRGAIGSFDFMTKKLMMNQHDIVQRVLNAQ